MKEKKVSRIFSDQRINAVIAGLLGLVIVVLGILYHYGIIESDDPGKNKNEFIFIGVGLACILFGIIKFIYEGKYKNCLIYNISREWDEDDLVEKISGYEFCSNTYAEYEAEYINVYIDIDKYTFEARITRNHLNMSVDYSDSYINSLPENTDGDSLKDYSKYVEEYNSLKMTKEEFVNIFVSYVLKIKDFL